MFIEPITLETRPRTSDVRGAAQASNDEWPGFGAVDASTASAFRMGGPQAIGLLGFTERVQSLIQELKWEDEQLLMTPRNESGPREDFSDSASVSDMLASLRTQFSEDSGITLGSQANLFPETVLSLLGGSFL